MAMTPVSKLSRQVIGAVIPTHNRVSLIGQALDSLLSQTLPDCEAIIVDDGSYLPRHFTMPPTHRRAKW
jgi:Glycosyl transferase family 2